MSGDRLLLDMRGASDALNNRQSAYGAVGERNLQGLAKAAAFRLAEACDALVELENAEREAGKRGVHV